MRLGAYTSWRSLDPGSDEFATIAQALFQAYPDDLNPARAGALAIDKMDAPSHPGVLVARIRHRGDELGPWPVFALLGPDFFIYASGQAEDVEALNLRVKPHLADDEEFAAYARLYLEFSRSGDNGRLIESLDDIAWNGDPTGPQIEELMTLVKPIAFGKADRHGRQAARALIQKTGAIWDVPLVIWPDGVVLRRDGRVVFADPALEAPAPLLPFAELKGSDFAAQAAKDASRASLSGVFDLTPARPATKDADPFGLFNDPAPPPKPHALGDAFLRLADVLLSRAIEASFKVKRGEKAPERFFDYLKTFRPTLVLATPYAELADEYATRIGRALNMKVNRGLIDAQADQVARIVKKLDASGEVVLITETAFNLVRDYSYLSVNTLLGPIVRGPHVALIVVDRTGALPQEARDMADYVLDMPRLDEKAFWEGSARLFDTPIRKRAADWLRYAQPRDMARVAAAAAGDPARYLAELQAIVERRLGRYTAPNAPSLDELQGLGEALHMVKRLASDIRQAVAGKIGWDQVDRGYLLAGPPGAGKTTLVRALAKDCGIRFVLASASAWQEASSLGPHVQSIKATFREARLYAPSILFIDEIDSIGSRARTDARNAYYETLVVNTVLEEMQGFGDREGVIVIGATNNPDAVDEALRRPGRFDRTIQVPYPNIAALEAIYGYYLKKAEKDGVTVEPTDRLRLAQLSFGRTGAHVELYVRGAIRRARQAARALREEDIVAEITARPPDELAQPLSKDMMRRVAAHEAGHALMILTGPDKDADVPMVSITPRSDGSLGFAAHAPSALGVKTRTEMEEQIRVTLGGRAAEETIFGADQISGGAGGSAGSDLARATQSVLWLLTEFGFSEAGGLLWVDWHAQGEGSQITAEAIRNLPMGERILTEARETLDRLYAETLERLMTHRGALERVIDALLEKQELSSEELREAIGLS